MLNGTCLCGAAGWRYRGPPQNTTICNCSICRRYGAIWAYGHLGAEIEPWGETTAVAVAPKTCDFHFCATCGCVTHYVARAAYEDGRVKAAVNLRMAADPAMILDLPLLHCEGAVTMTDVVPEAPGIARHVRDLWI